ncbi:phosphoglucosamine mutase [Prosthecochloris sp. HL-130-GSB]|jgi:phosphomannomutase|uniref:phosphoglucosamine mutase n=1 Tax=Prosthecochloris sp. HL-130-GSB TaxID=1974213 RepID=UPI000A1C0617|nr:phosphoglucosamine mutase [Prosthecochloris sp. HL-130-GSB]ARM30295.1 phosphoglucosamine mutase [Prosthecochloris sp. HL-130-GSB]MBO8091908.1 phosphoglucosamine mutase [Prosthecochloris sp.]
MSLMISVSGIRGIVGESLTPRVLSSFAQAFATWIRRRDGFRDRQPLVVIGRDSRPTGKAISGFVSNALALCGCRVLDLGLATTPTVEIATAEEHADGGIIITASHNPVEWNALKLLDAKGEFLDEAALEELLCILRDDDYDLARWESIGECRECSAYDGFHIRKVTGLSCIDTSRIARQCYSVLVDAVEGAGSVVVPDLCHALGIEQVETVACGGSGIFPRNPEPVAENLADTMQAIRDRKCDFGIIVDPDADRLALVCEDGSLFGEEYTLVACADFYLRYHSGPVVNNLSSSRALRDIALKHGVECHSAKVGEANVSAVMKSSGAVIGGEGNGGVILPELHYGRDALIGIGLFVQAFTEWRERVAPGGSLSAFRDQFPAYVMVKRKVELASRPESFSPLFDRLAGLYPEAVVSRQDGLKLDFDTSWVHVRPSNTEPVLRIYTEAVTEDDAVKLAERVIQEIEEA